MNRLLSWEVMDRDHGQIPFYSIPEDVPIQEYTPDYFAQVHNLYLATYREIAQSVPAIQSYIRNSIKASFITDSHELKKPERDRLWMALNSYNQVIGMIGLRIVSEDCFEIQKLAVAKHYRRKGISDKLWTVLESEGRRLCPKRPLRICLSTISLLEVAESYYKKKGFTQIRKDKMEGYDLDVYEKVE